MNQHRVTVTRTPRTIAAVAAAVLGLGLAPVAAVAAPTPAPAPSTTSTATSTATAEQAQAAKDAADKRVKELKTRIAGASKRVAQLSLAASRAETAYSAQLQVHAQAQAAAAAAKTALQAAEVDYRRAQGALDQIAVTNYVTGGALESLGPLSAAGLLTATDPGAVLDAVNYRDMAGQYQSQVVKAMTDAVARRQAAAEANRLALEAVAAQTQRLGTARAQAADAVAKSQNELRALQADLRDARVSQAEADARLSAFLGGWTMADPSRASALNEAYRKIAAKVKSLPLAPNTGKWTAAAGQSAVNRALQWIGTPYAWAGGDASGPTRGVCTAGEAANDCYLVGFDCSGLVLYAWAPYEPMAHFAATQYAQAGRMHPAVTKLLPGDLVFWSYDGTVGGIHHVAMYIGEGNVIQAPQSGDIVRITPLGSVSDGYFGATRPLT